MKTAKIALIGGQNVGKTSIIQRYVKHSFSEHPGVTVNGSCVKKEVHLSKVSVVLDIWDTAGQEKYRSIGPLFYRDAICCVAVYNSDDHESFNALQEYIDDYKECGPENGIIFICANKIDLIDPDSSLIKSGKDLASSLKAPFYMTSAKTGQNIDELFIEIANSVYNYNGHSYKSNALSNTNNNGCVC